MRLLPAMFAALVCASAASAQEKPLETLGASVAAPDTTAAPEAQNTPRPDPAKATPHRTRMTWEQRFAQANVTHDGHLTPEQAKLGYATVARHFHDIDLDGKGFVTEDDVRAWHESQRAARHSGQAHEASPLQPQPAYQRILPPPALQLHTSTDRTLSQTDHVPDPMSSVEAAPMPETPSDKPGAPF